MHTTVIQYESSGTWSWRSILQMADAFKSCQGVKGALCIVFQVQERSRCPLWRDGHVSSPDCDVVLPLWRRVAAREPSWLATPPIYWPAGGGRPAETMERLGWGWANLARGWKACRSQPTGKQPTAASSLPPLIRANTITDTDLGSSNLGLDFRFFWLLFVLQIINSMTQLELKIHTPARCGVCWSLVMSYGYFVCSISWFVFSLSKNVTIASIAIDII